MRADDAASRSRRRDAVVQTADEKIPHRRASDADAKRAEASSAIKPIHSDTQTQTSNSDPETSVEDSLDCASEAADDDYRDREPVAHVDAPPVKRSRGRPRGSLNKKTLLALGRPPPAPHVKRPRGRPPKVRISMGMNDFK